MLGVCDYRFRDGEEAVGLVLGEVEMLRREVAVES
jgi:hypothetical protein